MVNENTQGVIPLSGRGLVRYRQGEYAPGDFSTLVNAEVTAEGAVVTRRPYFACANDGHQTDDNAWEFQYNIVGHYRDGVITSGTNRIGYLKGDGPLQTLSWDASEVTTDLGGNCKWSKLVGFVRYNHINYWMFLCNFDDGAGEVWFEYQLYYKAETNPLSDDIMDITFPGTNTKVFSTRHSLTATGITPNGTGGTASEPDGSTPTAGDIVVHYDGVPFFRGMFIHKERLWLVTNRQVLFSKATDPATWGVPDGGFFNFDEKSVNDAVALKDSIYVVCDNSVSVINYSNDPNSLGDVTVKEISSALGGDAAVAIGDVVYFARDNGLYGIVNNSVTRVLDLNVRYEWNQWATWRLVPFGNYIMAMYSIFTNYEDFGDPHSEDENAADSTTWDTDPNLMTGHFCTVNTWELDDFTTDGDVIFINTETGSIHGFSTSQDGVIVDAYLCPVEDSLNRMALYIMSRDIVGLGGNAARFGRMFVSEGDSQQVYSDSILTNNTVSFSIDETKIPVMIEIQNYQPDGSVYFMKKFRNLLIEGEVPNNTFIAFNFSELTTQWATPIRLLSGSRANAIYPFERRVPINQRSRGLTLKLYSDEETLDEDFTRLCITRLVTLWTYTGRGPVSRDGSTGRDSQAG